MNIRSIHKESKVRLLFKLFTSGQMEQKKKHRKRVNLGSINIWNKKFSELIISNCKRKGGLERTATDKSMTNGQISARNSCGEKKKQKEKYFSQVKNSIRREKNRIFASDENVDAIIKDKRSPQKKRADDNQQQPRLIAAASSHHRASPPNRRPQSSERRNWENILGLTICPHRKKNNLGLTRPKKKYPAQESEDPSHPTNKAHILKYYADLISFKFNKYFQY